MSAHELKATIEGDGETLHVGFRWVCNEKGDPDRKCAQPVAANDCDGEGRCGGWWFGADHLHDNPDPASADCGYAPWFENLDGMFTGTHSLTIPIASVGWTGDEFPAAVIGGAA